MQRLKNRVLAIGATILLCMSLGGAWMATHNLASTTVTRTHTHLLACPGTNSPPCN